MHPTEVPTFKKKYSICNPNQSTRLNRPGLIPKFRNAPTPTQTHSISYAPNQHGVGECITIGPRFWRRVQIDLCTSLLPRWPRFRPRWLALVDNAVNLVEKCLVLMQNTSLSYFSTSFLLFNLVFNEVTTLSTSLSTWLPRFQRGNHVLYLVLCLVLCSMPRSMFYASFYASF